MFIARRCVGWAYKVHHVPHLRTRHGRLTWVKGRTEVSSPQQLCYNSRPKQTLGCRSTGSGVRTLEHRLHSLCPDKQAFTQLWSLSKFCHFGVSKCCRRKHERGITSRLAVNVIVTHTHTYTHVAKLTLSCKREMTHY